MSSITWRKGQVITTKHELTGYKMIMEISKDKVTLSPLFGWYKLTYQEYAIDYVDMHYKNYDNKGLHPIVQARYDHEYMRRINKL